MRKIAVFVILLSAGACCPLLHANDTFATVGAGRLIAKKTNEITMESEDLNNSPRRITVRYVFRNVTDRDVKMLIAFPLPDLDGSLVENEPVNIPDEKSRMRNASTTWTFL